MSSASRPSNMDATFGALATRTWIAAAELGVLERLARGPATARALARAARANARSLAMILNALAGLGWLDRRGDRYALSGQLRAMLAAPGVDAETYFQDSLSHLKRMLANWSQLTEIVRTGKPCIRMNDETEGANPFTTLARALFPGNYVAAKALVRKLPEAFRKGPMRILDVAAGSAAWSIPFARANRSAQVAAVDFPPVLDVARHFTRACGVEGRYAFLPGDIRLIRFGADRYDLIILGHICHSEGAVHSRRLFKKMRRALRPKGRMLVADFLADEERRGRAIGAFPLLFALNMLVHTQEGNTFTLSEYRAWAREAGFGRGRRIETPGPADILLFET